MNTVDGEIMRLFYIDESGQSEYTGETGLFVQSAVCLPDSEWKNINTSLFGLKRTYFDSVDVEIKSNWFRNSHERQKHYLDPFKLSDADLAEFVTKVYELFNSYDITVFAVVIDKRQMQKRFKAPERPNALAYRMLFESIEVFLTQEVDDFGMVIFDKITEMVAKKQGYEDLLYRQHVRYLEKGTGFLSINRIIEGLLFIPSNESNLIQLADLCAYNIYRQFMIYGKEWDKSGKFRHYYNFFKLIDPKIWKGKDGNYRNSGIKKYP